MLESCYLTTILRKYSISSTLLKEGGNPQNSYLTSRPVYIYSNMRAVNGRERHSNLNVAVQSELVIEDEDDRVEYRTPMIPKRCGQYA